MSDLNVPAFVFGLEPKAAVAWFEAKGHRLSWNWQETWQQANARAFTVAKVARVDVLNDIRGALTTALKEGKTERWFIKELQPILERKGWWGKRFVVDPEGNTERVQLGSPQRLRTIFRTNIQSAYMAGRWTSMVRNADERPYWMYVAVMDSRVRLTHAALNGKVYRWDDPIWQTHYPPSAFNCRCRVRALSERQLHRMKLGVDRSAGKMREKTVDNGVDQRSGEIYEARLSGIDLIGPKGRPITFWTDPGWSYNPGQAAYMPELDRYPTDVARQFVEGVVTGPEFGRWFGIWEREVKAAAAALPAAGSRAAVKAVAPKASVGSGMEYPVAVLRDSDRAALGTDSQTVLLSTQTLIEHLSAHPEIGLHDYQLMQMLVDRGEVYQEDDRRIILLSQAGKLYRAAIKVDQGKKRLYLLSLFQTTQSLANKQVRNVLPRLR